MFDSVVSFFSGVAAAVTVKMIASFDDIIWLSPFLTENIPLKSRLNNVLVYTIVCNLQTFVAYSIATGGEEIIDVFLKANFGDNAISTDKFMTLLSGACLGVYAIFITYEYYQEEILGEKDDDDEKDGGYDSIPPEDPDEANKAVKTEASSLTDQTSVSYSEVSYSEVSSEDNPVIDDEGTKAQNVTRKTRDLFMISFLGSLDDLTLFIPLLVGKTFGVIELSLGTVIATTIIVIFCVFLVKCKPVADFLERLPLCVIVISFSVGLLLKGSSMK